MTAAQEKPRAGRRGVVLWFAIRRGVSPGALPWRAGARLAERAANYFACFSLIAACAAARRAIGTRNGEQET